MSLWKRAPQTLGERLFLVRTEHGLTWGQGARRLGVETLDVAAFEQGHPVQPRVLREFSEVFAVQWAWLLLGVGQRYTSSSLLSSTDTGLL